MFIKYLIGAIAIGMSVSATVAHSVPSYEYNAGGEIIGITSVSVQGTLWDMTLHDGSFAALYATAGETALYDGTFALDASDALFDFMHVDTFAPATLLGCVGDHACLIYTAITRNPGGDEVNGRYFQYTADPTLMLTGSHVTTGDVNHRDQTWATWTTSSLNVPEPSIAILMASGLFAFGVVRRKSRA